MKWERITDWIGQYESLGGYITGEEYCLQDARRIQNKGGHARVGKRNRYQKEWCVERPANEVTILSGEDDEG